MRIFFGPCNIAGILGEYAAQLRKMGHRADVVVIDGGGAFGFVPDTTLNFQELPPMRRVLGRGLFFLRALRDYDVFHFDHSMTLLPRHWDLPLLRLAGKKVVMHFTGCEVRLKRDVLEQNREFKVCEHCDKPACDDEKKLRSIARIKRWCHALLAGGPEYCTALKEGEYSLDFPVGLDLEVWRPVETPTRDDPLVVHLPSRPTIKGTPFVLEAVDRLRSEGLKFRFRLIEGLPHEEVMDVLREADIVVDQLLIGWHGRLALEAMALSKPVLCHISEKCESFADGLPVVRTSPESLADDLRALLLDGGLRVETGIKGRQFVERKHDARKIAERLADFYRRV